MQTSEKEINRAFAIFEIMVKYEGPEQFAWCIAYFFRGGNFER